MLTTNLATVRWSVAALAVTLVYPYTKRFVSMPQAVPRVAFSFGIPMAFAAVQGDVPALAAWLLVGNAFWVLATTTPVRDGRSRRRRPHRHPPRRSPSAAGTWPAWPRFLRGLRCQLGLLGRHVGLGGAYFARLAVAAAQALWHLGLIRDRSRDELLQTFRLNHWLGCAVFAGVALDAIVRAPEGLSARTRRRAPAPAAAPPAARRRTRASRRRPRTERGEGGAALGRDARARSFGGSGSSGTPGELCSPGERGQRELPPCSGVRPIPAAASIIASTEIEDVGRARARQRGHRVEVGLVRDPACARSARAHSTRPGRWRRPPRVQAGDALAR